MPYIQALILSLALHLGAIWYLSHLEMPALSPQEQVIEVVYVNKAPRQFVTDPKLGKIIEKLQDQAKYLSQFSRQVEKEMVARNTGETQNRKNSGPPSIERPIPKGVGGFVQQNTDSEAVDWTPKSFMEPSTVSNHIPNVERGGFTALNTNRLLYYSFFARIEEQVRHRWVSGLRILSQELSVAELNKLAQKTRITTIEVLLDMTGMYVESRVLQESGYLGLDQAAIFAFKDAAPFRNPPMDLIEKDGYIHLKYGFYVEWSPSYFARSK